MLGILWKCPKMGRILVRRLHRSVKSSSRGSARVRSYSREWHFASGRICARRFRRQPHSPASKRSGRREFAHHLCGFVWRGVTRSAMLMHHEMDTRPQYSPWLAGVLVARHSGSAASVGHSRSTLSARQLHAASYALSLHASAEASFSPRLEYRRAHTLSRCTTHHHVTPNRLTRRCRHVLGQG